MSVNPIEHEQLAPAQPENEPESFRRIREALAEGAAWVISYAQDDLEKYGRYGNKPYAYYRRPEQTTLTVVPDLPDTIVE